MALVASSAMIEGSACLSFARGLGLPDGFQGSGVEHGFGSLAVADCGAARVEIAGHESLRRCPQVGNHAGAGSRGGRIAPAVAHIVDDVGDILVGDSGAHGRHWGKTVARGQIGGDRLQIPVGQKAQAIVDGFLHRTQGHTESGREAGLQEGDELSLRPVSRSLPSVGRDVGCEPALDRAAFQPSAPLRRTHYVALVVALAAMPQPFDEISAALDLGAGLRGLAGGRRGRARLEEQQAPAGKSRPDVEGKARP